jgi:hypothetical protein
MGILEQLKGGKKDNFKPQSDRITSQNSGESGREVGQKY